MGTKRQFFTPEGYRKLTQNPFVDKKMLQFVKDRTRQPPPSSKTSLPDTAIEPQYRVEQQPIKKSRNVQRKSRDVSRSVMSEKAAKLIATAIKGLLRE
jgi:hypothetical protein